MAGRTEARITALLSLLAVTLLAHALLLQPPRAAAVFADRLLSALRFDARQLLGLVSRRNMILLCHAILLLILRDAGLLAAPARRRRGAATAAGGEDACSEAQPKPKSDGDIAGGAAESRVKPQRRRDPEPDQAVARARRGKPLTGAAPRTYAAVQDVVLAEQRSSHSCFADAGSGVGHEIAAVAEDKIACLHSEPVTDDERSSRGEVMGPQETEPECVDDVDEMNKKFEEFIASMRRKMQLECRQAAVGQGLECR